MTKFCLLCSTLTFARSLSGVEAGERRSEVAECIEALSEASRCRVGGRLESMEASRKRDSLPMRLRKDDVEARGAPVERKGETVWEGGADETLLPLMWMEGTEGVDVPDVPVTSRLAFRSRGKRDVRVERRLSVLWGSRAEGWTLL